MSVARRRHIGGAALTLLLAMTGLEGQEAPPPVIDMHLHAVPIDQNGPPPVSICAPFDEWPTRDPAGPTIAWFIGMMKAPPCANALRSPETQEELHAQTIEVLERRNVIGVASGPPGLVDQLAAASDRVIPALLLTAGAPDAPSVETVREWFESGRFAVLGELTGQYAGIGFSDPAMEPYLALAEELDIPVAWHLGPGPPGVGYFPGAGYRVSLSSALTMEEALLRHPNLRVYAMHAGWPLIDDMVAMMYGHPQLHVDVGIISFGIPRPEFHGYLKRLVDAGLGKRIMFGSDQMQWPEAIEVGIEAIESAPFLTESQKRDILYHNAARFLRLESGETTSR